MAANIRSRELIVVFMAISPWSCARYRIVPVLPSIHHKKRSFTALIKIPYIVFTFKEEIPMSENTRIPRRRPLAARVGVFGVGHRTYWDQFEGLLDEMHRKLDVFVAKVQSHGVEVKNFGIVDDARSAYYYFVK